MLCAPDRARPRAAQQEQIDYLDDIGWVRWEDSIPVGRGFKAFSDAAAW